MLNNLYTFLLKWRTIYTLKPSVYVLTYHGVMIEKEHAFWDRNTTLFSHFKEHIQLIKRYHCLSEEELAGHLKGTFNITKPSFIITFDDGYANNLAAIELLAQNQLPCFVFPTTYPIESQTWLWTNDLALAFRYSNLQTINYENNSYSLATETNRIASFNQIRNALKHLPASVRIPLYDKLIKQLLPQNLDELRLNHPGYNMLSVSELQQITTYAHIGCHGVYHHPLHQLESEQTMYDELFGAKQKLENWIGKPIQSIAYPNGNVNNTCIQIAEQIGLKIGFSTQVGKVTDKSLPLNLPRIDAVKPANGLLKQLAEL